MIKTIVAVFLIVIGGAVPTPAQDAARSLSELRTVARWGDTIRLLDVDGHEVRGKIYKVNELDVEMRITRSGLSRWNESEIRRIRRRDDDSVRNGARNGLIVGGVLGLIQGLYLRKTHIPGIVPLSIALHGGLGMTFGIGLDSLMTRDRVIFERPGAPVIAAMPSPPPAKATGITVKF